MASLRQRTPLVLSISYLLLGSCEPANRESVSSVLRPCQDCPVHLKHHTRLHSSERPGDPGIGYPNGIAQDIAGRTYLASAQDAQYIQVYDSSGQFGGTIGRAGPGPGEFRNARSVHARGDTLYVLDSRSAKLVAYQSDGSLVREQRVPIGMEDFFVRPNGTLTVRGLVAASSTMHAIHLLDNDGRIVLSFAGSDEPFDERRAQLFRWPIARGARGSAWTAERMRYRLTQWDESGRLLRDLTRKADWFAPHDAVPRFRPGIKPGPLVTKLREDSEGLIWVLIAVPDDEWDDPSHYASRQGVPEFQGDVGRYFDTILEVIDPVRAEVIAHGRFDEHMVAFLDDDRLVSYGFDLNDQPVIDIWRVEVGHEGDRQTLSGTVGPTSADHVR